MHKLYRCWAMVACFLMLASGVMAQAPQPGTSLYVAPDFNRAYARGTRSWDGKPGPNYWQNRSSYQIKASLDPKTRLLRGEQTVTYYNESPDTLRAIVVRLYPNLLRKGAARDEAIEPENAGDGVKLNRVTVAGNEARPIDQGTLQVIRLPQPLMPKSNVQLTMSWEYNIPNQEGLRTGTYADSSFLVAYWYPQIAVYDDVYGWDNIPFKGMVEFYNDFSDFDVEITLPRNHLVWATGSFLNPDDVLAEPYLGRYKQATTSDQIVKIITPEDLPKRNFTKGTGSQTWRFQQKAVTDFAFATSSTYLWDATSAVVDGNGRRVTVGAAYQPSSRDFYHVAQFAKESVQWFSTGMPGVPYPFPSVTIFNGDGGMEFPGLVNDGSFPTLELAAEVTAHEVAHTYMPFYMGINEKRYSWMDEGFAQFLPNGYEFTNPQTGGKFKVQVGSLAIAYARSAGRMTEMPLMVPSYVITGSYGSYANHAYMRSGNMYTILQDLLGPELFKRTLQEYMARWNGKHPIPYDFFQTFSNASGRNLDWFFRPWAFEFGAPDLAIGEVTVKGKETSIRVDRKGIIPIPVYLTVTFADGTTEVVRETAGVWEKGAQSHTIRRAFGKAVTKVEQGAGWIPDAVPANNTWSQTAGK